MKNFRQFLHTSRDVFRIYLEIAPTFTIGLLVTQVLIQLQGVINAFIFGVFLDRVINVISGSKDITALFPIVLIYLFVSLVTSVVGVLNNYYNSLLSSVDGARLRLKQIDLMVRLGITSTENAELTNKSTRFSELSGSMDQHLSLVIGLISMIVSAGVYGVAIYSFAPQIILICLVLFVIKYLNNSRYIKKIWQLNRDSTEDRRNAQDSSYDLISPNSLKELILSGGVDFLREKYVKFNDWYINAFGNLRSKWVVWEIIHTISDLIVMGFGIFLLVERTIVGSLSIGVFTFYFRSIISFFDLIDKLTYRIARTIESSIRIQDALELFELYTPEADGNKELEMGGKPPVIEIKNISFTYPNGSNPVIKDINLVFAQGEKVAIVGENGAGKTTLVKLLTRIYRPQDGSVTLNGININDLKKASLYKKFGVLFQDFNSYANLTVTENVQIGKVSRRLEKKLIEKALIKADAMNFVKVYPKYLDQILSERYKGGIRPSGGQWQKIAIARLFYRNAPILILDEPTASIDAVSEAKIFDNVYKFMKGKTVIIISHRFSTVRNADRILVLDKGKIIEEGNHEKLMKMDGKYAHAFKLQAKGYQ